MTKSETMVKAIWPDATLIFNSGQPTNKFIVWSGPDDRFEVLGKFPLLGHGTSAESAWDHAAIGIVRQDEFDRSRAAA